MKQALIFLCISLLSFSGSFAYTQTELTAKKETYKTVIKKKVGAKLENMSEEKLRKILLLVDTLVTKYEGETNLSNTKRLQKVAILLAFKEIVSDRLEDEFNDISNILETVNDNSEIIIITDERCGEKCNTTQLISQLQQVPSLRDVSFVEKDFSSEEAKAILRKSGITTLPAAIFPHNFYSELTTYLKKTSDGKYSLELGSTFNPYEERSERGFKTLDSQVLSTIRATSYIKGDRNAQILWLEYSDMECPFCAKLHNSGTPKDLEKKYGNKLAYSLQHFPLDFHKNALDAAHYLECTGKIKGKNAFYELEDKIFAANDSSEKFIIETAVGEMGISNKELVDCVNNKEFSEKILQQQKRGGQLFGVTGTPGNVLINTYTGEYELISGAYPTSEFIKIIDKLLK